MSSAYFLIPLGLVLMGAAVAAFFWAVNAGQFDDLDEGSRLALQPDETVDRDREPPGDRA